MQPIGNLFASYQRLVRDLCAELGKRVEIEIESGQTGLDREMIEVIRDPLLHIVRNAVDHGIESPAERRAAGKPEVGLLKFSARQTGNEIRISISDDGRGIDTASLVTRAIARGLISAEQAEALTPRQRNALICEPGLSSAAQVTQLSGRGVGMDVVRASIERLGGGLKIDSTPGSGCRILLDVPLTLSIVPSITVRCGDHVFALPRSYVDEIVRNSELIEAEPIGGMRHVALRGELRPCVSLAEILGVETGVAALDQSLVMMRMIDGSVFALGVDGIVDHKDLVVRPVSPHIVDTGLYVGVAQLDDGSPALIVNVAGVATTAGLIFEFHGRSALRIEKQANEDRADLLPVILFNGLDGIRKAVPIEQVERLFEVEVASIGRGGNGPHVIHGERIFPLAGLAGSIPDEGTLDVLLLRDGERTVALATDGWVDAAQIDRSTLSGQVGLHDGRSVELIENFEPDQSSTLAPRGGRTPSCRIPGDDPWSRQFLAPLVSAAGYQIIDRRDAAVDLEIVLDSDPADQSAVDLANQVLVIATDRKRATQASGAIHRDDHDSLARALRAVRDGRRG
jgi:two-component system chemotaxis sensor kinase CheA